MAKLKAYVISCSGDAIDLDARNLFVWGSFGRATWLPGTKAEMKKRLEMCRRENQCANCDAEIHEVVIERTKLILRQIEIRGESAEKIMCCRCKTLKPETEFSPTGKRKHICKACYNLYYRRYYKKHKNNV